jgi:hypothetical protein
MSAPPSSTSSPSSTTTTTPIQSRKNQKRRRTWNTPPALSLFDDEKMLEEAEHLLLENELIQEAWNDKQTDDDKELKVLSSQASQQDWKLNATELNLNNRQIF